MIGGARFVSECRTALNFFQPPSYDRCFILSSGTNDTLFILDSPSISIKKHAMSKIEDDYGDESLSLVKTDEAETTSLDTIVSDESICSSHSTQTSGSCSLPVSPSTPDISNTKFTVSPAVSTAQVQPLHEARDSKRAGAIAGLRIAANAQEGNSPKLDTGQSTAEGGKSYSCDHLPTELPSFMDTQGCMWTSSHAANSPSEDRSSSLVNVLLRPLQDDESESHEPGNQVLIRLSLWSVIDGHGGGCVATYISEVLLPHIAASVSRALKCSIVDRGVCIVNGELRDANALDLDGLIRTSDRSRANPSSIHYRSPSESTMNEDPALAHSEEESVAYGPLELHEQHPVSEEAPSLATPTTPQDVHSLSSVKTSVKTTASHRLDEAPVGCHSPAEVANITRAITESFLAVDEGWINSIDPAATHQTSCQSNGKWNAGACALVVFAVQRLEWTSASVEETKMGPGDQDARDDTSHNKDAARRRMLDYTTQGKFASSLSTVSSTSSLTVDDPTSTSAIESEITEDDEAPDTPVSARKSRSRSSAALPSVPKQTTICTPGGCGCHVYRAREAMMYTAHVGDCRAVLLGSAPPRTIKVRPAGPSNFDHIDTTDDESSYHSSDETECLSSSDHDAESSDEESPPEMSEVTSTSPPYMNYMRRPSRRCRRSPRDSGGHAPFVALPPLEDTAAAATDFASGRVRSASRGEMARETTRGPERGAKGETVPAEYSTPPLDLSPCTRPIDLTTDHSAYNPAEVSAVLRRCNNAPRAISTGVGGGIKRVAGSLAVTRAFGDAYLKTPKLSFSPYKSHAPYITARPEVNCRLLTKAVDRVLVLATDGVWERCSGEDVLRWVRNYSAERRADIERRGRARRGPATSGSQDERSSPSPTEYEGDADVGQKRERVSPPPTVAKKRKISRRPVRSANPLPTRSSVADVVVRRVLNKVRKARNMASLSALMALPKGRARRSKHDDITASVVDLSAFVS